MQQQQKPQQQQQQQQQQDGSPLLRALRQLGDAAFSELLRPRLRYSSTGPLALACRELRALCRRTRQRLYFKHTEAMTHGAAALMPECYLACTSVRLEIYCTEAVLEALPALLPSLARLRALSSLHLSTHGTGSSSVGVGCMLRMAREQLPQLRQLMLESHSCSWTSDAFAWRTLASLAQLSSLRISVSLVPEGGSLQHMTALSRLVQLQHLSVQHSWALAGPLHGPQSHSYLASLGGLTHLQVLLLSTDGLAAIGSCSNLRHLHLIARISEVQLDEAVCAAFQQLVQLTALCIQGGIGTASPAFAAALADMRQLEELQLPQAAHATLAALAGATRLTSLAAKWAAGDAPAAAALVQSCASVRVVDLHGRGIPWQAFPGAERIMQQTPDWAPAEFVSISAHCRQLTALEWLRHSASRMLPSAPAADRAAAIHSLASLGELRQLTWTPHDNVELAALAAVSQLTALTAWYCDSDCTPAGMSQLVAGVRQLQDVRFSAGLLRALSEADALALLCACGHVQTLKVWELEGEPYDVFVNALHDAKAAGLSVPRDVEFEERYWD